MASSQSFLWAISRALPHRANYAAACCSVTSTRYSSDEIDIVASSAQRVGVELFSFCDGPKGLTAICSVREGKVCVIG
jgi:hypothetical protein